MHAHVTVVSHSALRRTPAAGLAHARPSQAGACRSPVHDSAAGDLVGRCAPQDVVHARVLCPGLHQAQGMLLALLALAADRLLLACMRRPDMRCLSMSHSCKISPAKDACWQTEAA